MFTGKVTDIRTAAHWHFQLFKLTLAGKDRDIYFPWFDLADTGTSLDTDSVFKVIMELT